MVASSAWAAVYRPVPHVRSLLPSHLPSNSTSSSSITRRAISVSFATTSCLSAIFPLLSFAAPSEPASPAAFADLPDSGGVKAFELRVGNGASPADGDQVVIHYYGRLAAKQGWRFDSTYDHKDSNGDPTPFMFTLGSSKVISGIETAVRSMKVGGIRRVIIPPSQGYQNQSQEPQPPNFFDRQRLFTTIFNPTRLANGEGSTLGTLIFDIELQQPWSFKGEGKSTCSRVSALSSRDERGPIPLLSTISSSFYRIKSFPTKVNIWKKMGPTLVSALLVISLVINPPVAPALSVDIQRGASLFRQACIGCHDAGGNIIQPGATLFSKDLLRNGVDTKEEIYRITYFGKGRMPGFGEQCTPRGQCTFGPRLQDDEIKLLADFVRLQADHGWPSVPVDLE